MFISPVQPAELGEHCIDSKTGVVRKKPKLYSVPITYKEGVDKQVQDLLVKFN